MKDIPNLFGSLVFNDSVMKARLPKETYKKLKNTIQAGKSLDLEVANVVANANPHCNVLILPVLY